MSSFLALLRFFCAVFGARFFPVFDRCAVKGAPDNVVTDAREVFDPAASYEYDAVFLKVMSFSGNVRDDLLAVRQADPSDLPQG